MDICKIHTHTNGTCNGVAFKEEIWIVGGEIDHTHY